MALLKAHRSNELKPEDLKWTCDADVFDFENTKNVRPIEGNCWTRKRLKALRLGVELKSPGYNIFITGLSRYRKVYRNQTDAGINHTGLFQPLTITHM